MDLRLAPLLFILLAGCTMPSQPAPDSTSSEPALDATTYTLYADWNFVTLQAGQEFVFTLHVDGNVSSVSPHAGAHMGPVSVPADQASPSTYPVACKHGTDPIRVPNDLRVTCTAPIQPGTYYLRGHVRDSTGNLNWWTTEYSFEATP